MKYIPKDELDQRIDRFQSQLLEKGIKGALVVQAVDLFYFSGTAQNAHLYIPDKGEPVLMVRKSFSRAREESALKNVLPLTSLKKMPQILSELGYRVEGALGLELDILPAAQYLFYGQIFSDIKFVDVSGIIRSIRQIKSPYELELLRTSGKNMDQVYREIPGIIREGMTEIELAAKVECSARLTGHMGYIHMRAFNQSPFFGQLMSGETGAVPSAFDGPTGGPGVSPLQPQGASMKVIRKGEPILVDYVGIWNGYITDQTRIYSLGPLPDKLSFAFETALNIQSAVINKIKPGINGSELHELALHMAEEAGLAEWFMGYGSDQARFLGHGVGLELDELPVFAKGLNTVLTAGMVFAIEPKFVFPGEGVVGIENTFALTENGVEKITVTPDELVIV